MINLRRTTTQIGLKHYSFNPAAVLHNRLFDKDRLEANRAAHATAAAADAFGQNLRSFWSGESPRRSSYFYSWAFAISLSCADDVVAAFDPLLKPIFGTCHASSMRSRPAWESESIPSKLGYVPLYGCAKLGALLGVAAGVAADAFCKTQGARSHYTREYELQGAQLGAWVGGIIAWTWSQVLAGTGAACKASIYVPAALGAFVTAVVHPDAYTTCIVEGATNFVSPLPMLGHSLKAWMRH